MNPEDSFSFNEDFSSNLQRIKISTVMSKVETGDERKETRDRVDEERRHQTEVSNHVRVNPYGLPAEHSIARPVSCG